ncbi:MULTISPECIES: NmrA/HSCARG family protein [unclassified Ensifer]|uniref:NmrA/HSCARG family protein n=1 Tax=unclassified Ensifer TaxID=2633371 RepID=UPI0008139CD6|nr:MULTISPECIES: NmrA/HSCARG family protein [unclassified Ensifer]OCP04240.1 epimerase [Ensifer sp. LC11]OCP04500.1 epimerase [Ensifer sp. LC13]OCP08907.1 epimerase [Ensifer sp. LC14]OCP30479.1 epimerase [Ensifer sp. LC499]
MNQRSNTILVVGATGRFAGLCVPELVRRGARVRALIRDEAHGALAKSLGASELAIGDLRRRASLDRALEGTDGVFHIGPAFAPDEAAMGMSMVEAAVRAGVRKFVFSSVIQPTNTRLKNHAAKIPVEDALYSSPIEYTILHPANFMQNLHAAWPGVLATGTFAEPFPKTARIARVDYRDVAEVAAIALTEDRLAYATLELCSEGRHNREEIAGMMSEALSRPIAAGTIDFHEWAKPIRAKYTDHQLELLAKVHAHYADVGLGGNSLTLRAALQREPRSLLSFIRELALPSDQDRTKTFH